MRRQVDFRSIITVSYAVLLLLVICFHEPWFDEAQSWLIAKDASLYDILFVRPHFEGHPSLWWLILSVPAKLGVPYEIGLKTVNYIFSLFVIYLLVYKSDFSKVVKCVLPFTYFFFYQHGVTSRPYSLMIAAMFLVAVTWKDRNTNPIKLTLSLALLCLASAYGIVLAGGSAIFWVLTVIKDERSLLKRKDRFVCWSILLIISIFLLLQIMPASNAAALEGNAFSVSDIIRSMYFFWFAMPSELFVTEMMDEVLLSNVRIGAVQLVCTTVISLIIWAALLYTCKRRRTTWLLLLPYAFMSLLASILYFSVHHIGILLAFFISICWINQDLEPFSIEDIPMFIRQVFQRMSDTRSRLYKRITLFLIAGISSISVIWTVYASITDILYNYREGRLLASVIKENDLENYKWYSAWLVDEEEDGQNSVYIDHPRQLQAGLIITNPYFDKNLIANSYNNCAFSSLEGTTPEQSEEDIKKMAEDGPPDIIFCMGENLGYYKEKLGVSELKYIPYSICVTHSPWKAKTYYSDIYIYVREDIYNDRLLGTETIHDYS